MELFGVKAGLHRDGLSAYSLVLPPGANKLHRHPVVVAFAQAGGEALAKERADYFKAFLDRGLGICFVQLRGMGVKGERGRTGGSTALSATELMLGETVLGHQLRELRELLAHLRQRPDVDATRLALMGDSLAKVNPADSLVAVPLDAAKMPELAEPGACLLALLGALFEEDVRAVYGRGGLVSYQSVLRSPFIYLPHDAVVPGALTTGDWVDIATALAPRSVRLEALVNGLNQRVANEDLEKAYATARQAFQKRGSGDNMSLGAEPAPVEALARWFAAALKE
jgi:hypothetical protein